MVYNELFIRPRSQKNMSKTTSPWNHEDSAPTKVTGTAFRKFPVALRLQP